MYEVKIYKAELLRFLNTPHGDRKTLWKHLERRGDLAVFGAKRKVGVKTGALQRSIHKRHLGNLTGQYLWIGSERGHALMHHEGTRRHIIRAPQNKVLKFQRGGQMVYTSQVRHPGTKPNPYLREQLKYFIK